MKTVIICLILCTFGCAYAQEVCGTYINNCQGCLAEKCIFCSGFPNYCIDTGSACGPGTSPTTSCNSGTTTDISTLASFNCFNQSDGQGNTVLGEYATVIDINVDKVFIEAISYSAVSPINKPSLFGYQYNQIDVGSGLSALGSVSIDSFAGYFSLLNAFEFLPNTADNSFDISVSQTIGVKINFTNPITSACQNQSLNGAIYDYFTFDYGNGWLVKCRIASIPVNETAEIEVGPTKAKCDVNFGSFSYSGEANTRLGLTIAFVIAGSSVAVKSNVNTGIKTCPDGNGICLIVGGASKAAVFTWIKSTTNTSGITISAVTEYTGSQSDFFLPTNAASGAVSSQAPTLGSVDVTAFADARTAVFSFANPLSGDIWDPSLSQTDSSTVIPTSAGSVFTYSFALIIAALIVKYI